MTMRVGAAMIAACVSVQAIAAPLMLYPVQTGAETARFRQGVPTLDLETPTGAVQITPLPFDHGHVTFGVAVYNKTIQPANFGIENVGATAEGQSIPVLAVDELEKRAKSRAMWSQIGVAVLAGAAAAAVANAHTTDHYYGHVRTPHGTYSWASSYRDNSIGVLGATAAVGVGAAGVVGIQNRLDATLDGLSGDIVQTTTVEGDASYGGRIVIEKTPNAKLPYDVHIAVSWNGVQYPFTFRVTKQGVNVPPPYGVPPAMPIAPQALGTPSTSPAALPTAVGAKVSYNAGRDAAKAAVAANGRAD